MRVDESLRGRMSYCLCACGPVPAWANEMLSVSDCVWVHNGIYICTERGKWSVCFSPRVIAYCVVEVCRRPVNVEIRVVLISALLGGE
jgi:hypothetical protein